MSDLPERLRRISTAEGMVYEQVSPTALKALAGEAVDALDALTERVREAETRERAVRRRLEKDHDGMAKRVREQRERAERAEEQVDALTERVRELEDPTPNDDAVADDFNAKWRDLRVRAERAEEDLRVMTESEDWCRREIERAEEQARKLAEELAQSLLQAGFTEECAFHGLKYSDFCGACAVSKKTLVLDEGTRSGWKQWAQSYGPPGLRAALAEYEREAG